MNSFSHYIVGSYLRKYIRREYGIRLSAARFLYWNIMTDFRKPYNMLPHKAACWETRLKSEVEALAGHKQTHGSFGPDYSKHLGVICHFYADFFCFPHTPAYEGTFRQHFRYEWELYIFMRKPIRSLVMTDLDVVSDACRDTEKIIGGYEALRQSYLSKQPSFENDLVFALRACLGAVTMITRASIMGPTVLSPAVSGQ
jgi:hypothetical protein